MDLKETYGREMNSLLWEGRTKLLRYWWEQGQLNKHVGNLLQRQRLKGIHYTQLLTQTRNEPVSRPNLDIGDF